MDNVWHLWPIPAGVWWNCGENAAASHFHAEDGSIPHVLHHCGRWPPCKTPRSRQVFIGMQIAIDFIIEWIKWTLPNRFALQKCKWSSVHVCRHRRTVWRPQEKKMTPFCFPALLINNHAKCACIMMNNEPTEKWPRAGHIFLCWVARLFRWPALKANQSAQSNPAELNQMELN